MLDRFSFLCVFLFTAIVNAQNEHEWPQFLGPNRNGISAETELIDSWPAGGLEEVWRVEAGPGMSGLAISRRRLLTMVQTDGKQRVICLDAQTGKPVWQTPVAPEYRNGQGDGPRATPTIAGGTVLTYTGEGVLVALRFSDGQMLWSHDVVTENGGKPADYGMSCSPLAVGDNAIVIAGTPSATVLAYDLESGKLAWHAGEIDPAGYSSPTLLNVGGRQQIVAFTGGSLLGLDPKIGRILWRYPYKTDYNCNIAAPVAVNDQIFISSGESHGCVLLNLSADGDQFQVREVWSSQGVKSVLRNEWQTSTLVNGYLYGFDNVGSAGQITHLTCINAATGQRTWQKLRFGKGNSIAADGKLFMTSMKGEVIIAKASPTSYQEIGRQTVIGTTRQSPAISNGLLYVRDSDEIVCLNVRSK